MLGWADLAGFKIGPSNYGNERVLRSNPTSSRAGRFLNAAGFGRPLLLEPLQGPMLDRYGSLGLRQPDPDFNSEQWEPRLAAAMSLIAAAPGALEAVRSLVWSLTPVGVEGPEYDSGYSDPALPFSVFIGAHCTADRVPAIRLAEGLLHEAMHLQLSLIEDVVPLISGNAELRPSPWQGRPRPTQGLLHGLYVFRVVQDWLKVAQAGGALTASDAAHAHRRLAQIDDECDELQALAESVDLTPHGRVLAAALLH